MNQQEKNAYLSISRETKRFLEQHLPQIGGEDWWQTHVFSQLTYGQQGQVRSRRIQTLGGLDLAALLRVFERNWAELSYTAHLPAVLRTYLHEIKELRNLVSHESVDGGDYSPSDRFRYLDTILRVMKALSADEDSCKQTEEERDAVFKSPEAVAAPPAEPRVVEVIREVKVEVPVEVIREVVREVRVEVPVSQNRAKVQPDLSKGIKIGSFILIGPEEPVAGKLLGFDKQELHASLIAWKVHHPDGLEFDLQVSMIDEGTAKEAGQVQCTNRNHSPREWDDVVNRLRIGFQSLEDGEWMMELRSAIRPGGSRATRNVLSLAEYEKKTGIRMETILKQQGATAVGTRAEISNDQGRNRNYPAATFLPGDSLVPAAAWVLTTLVPLLPK
jgi:hypothetical protein